VCIALHHDTTPLEEGKRKYLSSVSDISLCEKETILDVIATNCQLYIQSRRQNCAFQSKVYGKCMSDVSSLFDVQESRRCEMSVRS